MTESVARKGRFTPIVSFFGAAPGAPFRPGRELFLLALVFLLIEAFIWPWGNFPINDDFAYAKSVEVLLKKGYFDLGYWPAMSLVAQTYWGALFAKLFGFSFDVLRLSTLCLCFISVYGFHCLCFRLSKQLGVARLLSCLLLFSPLFLWSANSFMTEIPFVGLCILALVFYEKFFRTYDWSSFLLSTVFAILALFVRQLGIILPLGFLALTILLSLRDRRHLYGFGLLQLGLCLLLLYDFETHWLSNLSAESSYTGLFRRKPKKMDATFSALSYQLLMRLGGFVMYTGLFLLPLALRWWPARIRSFRFRGHHLPYLLLFLFLLACCRTAWNNYPIGNIFYPLSVGPINLGDEIIAGRHYFHFYNAVSETVIRWLSLAGVVLLAFVCLLRARPIRLLANPFLLFVGAVLAMYIALLIYSDSYFDRYAIPFFSLVLLLLASVASEPIPLGRRILVTGMALVILVFSVLTTHDYFNWNRQRWKAIEDLKVRGIDSRDIHGGFEQMAWENYNGKWFGDLVAVDKTYILVFEPIKGYVPFKAYPYQRLLPFKKDTLFVVIRQTQE